MVLYTHDIFNYEQEINELKQKLQTCTMESDDYSRCVDIFQTLGNTTQDIADGLRGKNLPKDAPISYFERFQLGTKLHRLQGDITEIIKVSNKLNKTSPNNRGGDLYETLEKHTERTMKQLEDIRQILPPSSKKPKKSSRAKRYKSEKVQELIVDNEIEQEHYPRFSTTTLGYSLQDESEQ